MRSLKQITAVLLACVLALGLLPGALGDAFTVEARADWEGGGISINEAAYNANDFFHIREYRDWNALAGFSSSTYNFAGKTICLDVDITLGGTIRAFEQFNGTFEGNRHKITLQDNPMFNALPGTPGQNGGLFRKMTGGKVSQLIVEINAARLWSNTRSPDPTAGFKSTDSVPYRAGVVAGHITGGSVITECAVMSRPGSSATFYHYRGTAESGNEVVAGGIVGKLEDGSEVSKCFVNINIETAITNDKDGVWLYTGGIAGWARNSRVEASGFWGDIQYYHPYPSIDNYNQSGAGGAVGYAQGASTTVKDNFVRATMTLYDLYEANGNDEDRTTNTEIKTQPNMSSMANAGGAAGKTDAYPAINLNYGTSRICYYVQGSPLYTSNALRGGKSLTGSNTNNLSTGAWGRASSDERMLDWMLAYSAPAAVAIDTTNYADPGNRVEVTVDLPFVDLNLNYPADPLLPMPHESATYESAGDTAWYAYLSYPTMGRQPTPTGMTTEAGGGAQSVNSIVITQPSVATLYGGLTYEFQATVNGTNLAGSFLNTYPVSFRYEYLDSGNAVVGTPVTNATGSLSLPSPLPAGATQLRVTPVCGVFSGACQPQVYPLTPGEISIAIAGGDDPFQGTRVQLEAELTGSAAFTGSAVTWSVSGGGTGTTNIDSAGLLTIDQAQTGTVTVEAAAGGATQTFAVPVTGQTFSLTAPDSGAVTVTGGSPGLSVELSSATAADWFIAGTNGNLSPTAAAINSTFEPTVPSGSETVTATVGADDAVFQITIRPTAAAAASHVILTDTPRTGQAVVINSVSTGTLGKITTSDATLTFEYLVSGTEITNPAAATWLPYDSAGGIPLDPVADKYVYLRTAADSTKEASDYLTYTHYTGSTWNSTGIGPSAGQSSGIEHTARKQVDTASGTVVFDGLANQAGGTITATVYPGNPRYGNKTNGLPSSDFFIKTESKETMGGVSETPVISLNTDTSLGHGVLITSRAANTQIFYTTAVNGATPQTPTTGSALYTGMIDFPTTATEFVVWAIAMDSGASKVSQVAKATFRKEDLSKPIAPELRMGDGLLFDNTTWYEPGTPVHFYHDQYDANDTGANANSIRYIVDGGTPSITSGTSYNPNAPYVLPSNKSTVTVRAVLIDTANRLESELLEVEINIRQKLAAPEPVVYEGVNYTTPTRPGSSVYLNLSAEAVTLLNAAGYNFSLVTYGSGTDAGMTVTGGAQPMAGMTYLSYQVNEGESITLPQIRYQTGTGDVSTGGIAYTYGVRKLTLHPGSVTQAAYTEVSYINPTAILLTGAPRENFTLSAIALSSADTYSDSEPKSYVYSFRDAVTALTSYPRTSADSPTAVQTGDIIELHSSSTAQIFYSLGTAQPKVAYVNGSWVPQDSNTLRYNPDSPIVVTGSSRLIYSINAIAVDPADSLESSQASFQYQLPSPVQAVTVNPAEGSVVKGTKITMYCATQGATIYYTTNGDDPEAFYSNVYDKNNPPVIEKKTTVTVMAELNGVTSEITSYEYKLASQMSAPSASLPTGHVVSKGSRIILSGSGTIAYTTDGKDPRSILEGENDSSEGNYVYYGNTVVLDGDYGESVTIRAYCYRSGYTPSETISYTYTISEREDYLAANPLSGSVVKPGSVIQLSTSVTDGKIFYTTGDAQPAVRNQYNTTYSYINDDLTAEYSTFEWEAAEGTTLGSTVQVTGQPGETLTIRAIAVTNGAEGGTPRVFNYRINERSAAPTASIPSGAITFAGAATALSAQGNAVIYYTTDGTEPTTDSYRYQEPVRLEGSIILKAMAVEEGKEPSEIVEYTYTQAGYVAAVTMSVTGGEVEQGTELAMSTLTEGATIYYTTNGTEPTTDSQVYTAPITVMRPVTIKAMAYLQGLHSSPVNTTGFTVFEPLPEETEGEDDAGRRPDQTDRLTSRRTYDEYVGPTYTDVVIYNNEAGALLAAEEGAVEKDTVLIVREAATTPMDQSAVRAEMDYNIVQLYDIYLERGGERVQPSGTVEVGLPIPAENRNGIVVVVCLGDDGTLEAFPTRRSDNMAYFMTSHFSRYAIVVPETQRGGAGSMLLVGILSGLATLLVAGAVLLLIKRRRRRRQEDEEARPTQ